MNEQNARIQILLNRNTHPSGEDALHIPSHFPDKNSRYIVSKDTENKSQRFITAYLRCIAYSAPFCFSLTDLIDLRKPSEDFVYTVGVTSIS